MKSIILIFFLLASSFLSLTNNVSASATGQGQGTAPTTVQLPNPLGTGANKTDIPTFLGQIISYALGLIGSLALVMFIYGGITWMLSAGSQEQVTKGKQIVIWAALGIAIIFISYALVHFIISAIGGVTAPTANP